MLPFPHLGRSSPTIVVKRRGPKWCFTIQGGAKPKFREVKLYFIIYLLEHPRGSEIIPRETKFLTTLNKALAVSLATHTLPMFKYHT